VIQLKAIPAPTSSSTSRHPSSPRRHRKAADIGWKPVQYLNNVSASVGSVMKPAGLEKSVRASSPRSTSRTPPTRQWENDPATGQGGTAWMKKYYPEGSQQGRRVHLYGYAVAQTLVQTLKQCGDNLTRENVMRQAANLRRTSSCRAAAGHHHQHQPDRLLSDPVGAARALQGRDLGSVRRRARFCLSKPSVLRNDIPHNESKRGKRRFIQGRQH
jgi:hypothetical protein